MKKFSILFGVILLLFACESDDTSNENAESDNNQELLGKWSIISSTEISEQDGDNVESLDECTLQESYNFKENGVVTYVSPNFASSGDCLLDISDGKYATNNNELTLSDLDLLFEKSTFEINQNVLTITIDVEAEEPDEMDYQMIEVFKKVN